jgi:UDPglucose--hexose-1-phosphate uridylyltransferase
MQYKSRFTKPDGRTLLLYSRRPIDANIVATSPSPTPVSLEGSHMRWHPLRGEWVAYARHRQNRTFLPPKEFNPLAPTVNPEFPTELPQGDYDVAVFENMFPTLSEKAVPPPQIPGVETYPALGVCEVVVFTKDPTMSLGRLPLDHIQLLLEVWGDRTREIGARPDINYVMPFENRGVEVGVTLHHPHGQIYAYPIVPPVPARENAQQLAYYEKHGIGLLASFIDREIRDRIRLIYEGPHAVAFVPACARYPYEVWVAPKRAVPTMDQLEDHERADFARALKTLLLKFDALWSRPFPYLMTFHQAPTDGREHPESHFYLEFSPPYRSSDRLKFLAGTELGAGLFANDSLPEDKARELQGVEVTFE